MFDEFNRPDWDTYFMGMCYLVSTRSIDPNTKHGCVIINIDHTILSVGYNGPPRKVDDSKVPLTRPEKYDWILHAEENAILNAARIGVSLEGSIAYITGRPCKHCARMLVNAGIKRVVIGPKISSCLTKEENAFVDLLFVRSGVDARFRYADVGDVLKETTKLFGKDAYSVVK